MNSYELTYRARAAKIGTMQCSSETIEAGKRRSQRRRVTAAMVVMAGALAIGGCVSVTAPDKPIVIELNINIKQDVVYRLATDVAKTIDENPGAF